MNKDTPLGPVAARIRIGRRTRRLVAATCGFLFAASLLLWMQRDIDREVLLAHNVLRDNAAVVGVFQAITRYGMSAMCLLLAAYMALSLRWRELSGAYAIYLLVLLGFGIASVTGDVLKMAAGRARPFVEYSGQINVTSELSTLSFPSGHATKSVALALPFVIFVAGGPVITRVMKLMLLLAASLVCYSRILLGVHFLSDVLAGAATAMACLPVAVAAANTIYERRKVTVEKLNVLAKRFAVLLLALAVLLPFI